MRVMMVSKACIVGIYQRKLEYIAAHDDLELLTIVPPSWDDERGTMPLEHAYTAGYQLETLPIRFNGHYHLHFYEGLRRRMHDFLPDVLHIDEEPYNLATWQMIYHARRMPNPPKTLFFSWQNINRSYAPPIRWLERWVLNTVDHAIVGTESAGEVWRGKGYNGDLTVIPQFGIDPHLFQPAAEKPQRPFTVGYIGRLVPEKGIDTLLDAVSHLPGEWRLSILGGGPLRESLKSTITQRNLNDRVTLHEQVPSVAMPAHYHTLDVLVLPSRTRPNWKEQFGRVLVEAMASGVPVIGSDSGAIPGVIGDAGLIFPEGEAAQLTKCLQTLRDDTALYTQLRQAGRQRALDHFTHEQIATGTVAVYQSLLHQG